MHLASIFTRGRKNIPKFIRMSSINIPANRHIPQGFNERDFMVFRLWAMHWSMKEIAEVVHMSPATVDGDIRIVYATLDVNSRDAAVQKAWLEGIFQKEDFEGIEWRGG